MGDLLVRCGLRSSLTADIQFHCCIALMRDTTKMIALGRATPAFSKAQIQVYSPAGEGLLLLSVDITLCGLTR